MIILLNRNVYCIFAYKKWYHNYIKH